MVDVYFLADEKNLERCYCCCHDSTGAGLHSDVRSILERLCIMLADPDTSRLINRHILLINHYLGLSQNQFTITDLPYLPIILEYLCNEVIREALYEKPLYSLLKVILKPPIIYLTSQSEEYESELSDYFTALANCYALLENQDHKFLIILAINNTISANRKNGNFVSQISCIRAIENSRLAQIFSTILSTTDNKRNAEHILDLWVNLTSMSDQLCVTSYKENFVERILSLSYLFLDNNSEPHLIYRAAFLLLRIMATALLSDFNSIIDLSSQAIRNLREWFCKEVLAGNKQMRNILLTVILTIIHTQNNVDIASSKLLEDIILLALAPKSVKESTWTGSIELKSNSSDFEFKKLLLITLYELLEYCPTKLVCERFEALAGLSQQFDEHIWPKEENTIILKYCLHLVPRLATYLHEEIIKYDLMAKMIYTSGKLAQTTDCDELFFYLIQSIYSLSINNNLTEYFKEKNIIPSLIDYCETILSMPFWSIRIQLVLQYSLNSIVNIFTKIGNVNCKCLRLASPAALSTDLMRRYLNPTDMDSIFDPCLLISIADFTWTIQCVDKYNKLDFIKLGGIYLILDVLEMVTKKMTVDSGSIILLGLLADLVEEELAVTQAVTWKGVTYPQIMNLLCHIWRVAEKEKMVKRINNCIEDYELPLMGCMQTNMGCIDPRSCPPLLEMIGCFRPKIFAIVSQLFKHHRSIVEITEDTYSALFRKMNTQDKVTHEIIKGYEFLKEGEIWQNILFSMKNIGMPPVAGDELLLHNLSLNHITIAREIQCVQKQHLDKQSKKELEEENNLYEKIRKSKTVEELDKYRNLEKKLLIENNRMRSVMKQLQLSQIEESMQNNWKKYNYMRTYNHQNNTSTVLMGRDIIATNKSINRKDTWKPC